jgi:hypothetical protein
MEFNLYVVVLAIAALCAIIGIYYCWVRKLNKHEESSTASKSGVRY